ncbi:helix-turn-helix domain-containing protein [Botrimarina mediterranea]|uniref:Helix-turn-helix domain protein n=1 Tax=Botrimarina mediterranea TaxID=2528022 RepID=A0A518KCN2_9BACT|nr:helix-turn-helix domain-containing protein [Botrimarina mediterranea]QDV75563.1 Helix-turn-helix domain protein [Botrimarina mediterranea]QDV80197.1 Helix-turn-helix domain protein [Planctomycetes bacterium K2D]
MSNEHENSDGMLTIQQVAERLNVSARLVYKLASTGALKAYRIGGAIRITTAQLTEYLGQCELPKAERHKRQLKHLDL